MLCVLPALISSPLHLPLCGRTAGTSSQALPALPGPLRFMRADPGASVREASLFSTQMEGEPQGGARS